MGLSPEYWRAVVRGEARGPGPALLRPLLWCASKPYALGVRWRNRGFDRGRDVHWAGVPVISIGNLTVGGTGKTPCVEYVARLLRERDVRVAILSRGYGAEGGRNDEAMVLEENLTDVPHLQDRDRVAIARTAVEELESEVLVLDDGFQHRRLARDVDIVLIDVTDPWGGGYLMPRGALREPVSSLRRASLIVLTRCDAADAEPVADAARGIAPGVPIARTVHAPLELTNGPDQRSVNVLRGQTVGTFCGLGNPTAFRGTLNDLGANVVEFREYPDHHPYSRADVEGLERWARNLPSDALVVTTQKDWVKLRTPTLGDRPLWALRIGLKFVEGRDAFDRAVLSVVPAAAE
ncbi:MAG TPA: tetraacyldisaccharide 4'-kinase [Gemmataceae bacterium]|nr:tetraacyldisaccharide 4'-kinase [Gemmataceae bacterium]